MQQDCILIEATENDFTLRKEFSAKLDRMQCVTVIFVVLRYTQLDSVLQMPAVEPDEETSFSVGRDANGEGTGGALPGKNVRALCVFCGIRIKQWAG